MHAARRHETRRDDRRESLRDAGARSRGLAAATVWRIQVGLRLAQQLRTAAPIRL